MAFETHSQRRHHSSSTLSYHSKLSFLMALALLPLSSSSSSSITYPFTYDVFLSFRGSDTRYGFTGNLYKALSDKGIHTFIDDEELHKGDEITPSLEKAIENSRIFIVILSKDYASSSFCLDELSKILDCTQEEGRLVWPIFYDVDPSNVRKQTGTFGEAMALHTERFKDNNDKLKKWRMALQQVANFSGRHFKDGHEYEHNFIENIVEEVSKKIKRVALYVAAYPVGLEPQVLNVISLLDLGSHDRVHLVGIHGTGGIGKTTLALAVYNSIAHHFESLCFLDNVRENYEKNGLVYLQNKLLLDVLGEKKIEITNPNQGISIIQQRLQQKKILLILDDVDKEEQLQRIVGRPDLLGHGSRVIITTRNQQLLKCQGVERTYKVKKLKKEDATELFRWKAFKTEEVKSSYEDLLNQALSYASGLPLALEVIGSNLFGKTREEWKCALEQYKRIPPKEIQKILEVSFDALEEEEQSVFLDIACCIKGYKLKEVKDILCAHYGFCIANHVRVLVQKSLINITCWAEEIVTLHDLIGDMGKEIVRQKSPREPGNRSRLWFHKDIFEVLEQNTGRSTIEMIHLDYPSSEEVDWDGEAFKEMKQLKTLIIKKIHFSKGPKHLPNSLRVLEWCEYPSQQFPRDFHPKKLLICKFPWSNFMSSGLVSSLKKFVTMKVLNMDECKYLTHIPDLSSLPCIEKLSFENCSNVITIDHSVGSLGKLKILNAKRCSQLRSFPPLKLPSLESLSLVFCQSLERFPEILDKMENITNLSLQGTPIRKLPSSFRNLTGLRQLLMMPQPGVDLTIREKTGWMLENEDEGENKVNSMPLEHLQLFGCNSDQSHGSIALLLSWFPNLKELELHRGTFQIVPECIKEFRYLLVLSLIGCKNLEEIEGIPPSLEYLHVYNCDSLSSSCKSILLKQELHEAGGTNCILPRLEAGRIPDWFEHQSSRDPSPSLSFQLFLLGCNQLREIEGIPPSLKYLSARGCESLSFSCRSMLLKQELHEAGNTDFYLPRLEAGRIPDWFEHQSSRDPSPSLSFWFRNKFPQNLLLCLDNENPKAVNVSVGGQVDFIVNGKVFSYNAGGSELKSVINHTCLLNIRRKDFIGDVDEALLENEWNHVELMSKPREYLTDKRRDIIGIGIHVLLKEKSSMEDIQFTSPYKRRRLELGLEPLQEINDVNTEFNNSGSLLCGNDSNVNKRE